MKWTTKPFYFNPDNKEEHLIVMYFMITRGKTEEWNLNLSWQVPAQTTQIRSINPTKIELLSNYLLCRNFCSAGSLALNKIFPKQPARHTGDMKYFRDFKNKPVDSFLT